MATVMAFSRGDQRALASVLGDDRAIIYLTKQVPDATRSGTGRRLI